MGALSYLVRRRVWAWLRQRAALPWLWGFFRLVDLSPKSVDSSCRRKPDKPPSPPPQRPKSHFRRPSSFFLGSLFFIYLGNAFLSRVYFLSLSLSLDWRSTDLSKIYFYFSSHFYLITFLFLFYLSRISAPVQGHVFFFRLCPNSRTPEWETHQELISSEQIPWRFSFFVFFSISIRVVCDRNLVLSRK